MKPGDVVKLSNQERFKALEGYGYIWILERKLKVGEKIPQEKGQVSNSGCWLCKDLATGKKASIHESRMVKHEAG